MATWTPITGQPVAYAQNASGDAASGYYLKFYAQGTSTPINMASDSAGGGLLAKCQLNTEGLPINGSSAVFIPHIDQNYRLVLYTNATDADNNTFASAAWDIDGIVKSDNGLRDALIASGGSALITHDDDSTTYNLATYLQNRHVINVKDTAWSGGAKGDGVTDDSAAIQAAIDYARANRTDHAIVYVPEGSYLLDAPIKLKQSVTLVGAGSLSGTTGGTEFIPSATLAALTPPADIYTDAAHLSGLSLAKTPVMYNTQLLTRSDIQGIRIDCNNLDVYGLYINERYFSKLDVNVLNCPNAPITLIYNQFCEDGLIESRQNGGPVRYVICAGTRVNGLDIEKNTSTGSCLDIVHDISTKTNVKIENLYYEEDASNYPTGATTSGGVIRIGGRSVEIDYASFTTFASAGTRYIDYLASSTSYSIDGATVTTVVCNKCKFESATITTPNIVPRLGSDANACTIDSTIPISSYVNNSTNYNHIFRDTTTIQFGRASEPLTNSDDTRLLGSVQDNRINLFSNANRYIETAGAELSIVNTSGQIRLEIDGSGTEALRVDNDSTAGNTRMYVYDVDNATLERVTVGAADSGGSGFKVLRIPN